MPIRHIYYIYVVGECKIIIFYLIGRLFRPGKAGWYRAQQMPGNGAGQTKLQHTTPHTDRTTLLTTPYSKGPDQACRCRQIANICFLRKFLLCLQSLYSLNTLNFSWVSKPWVEQRSLQQLPGRKLKVRIVQFLGRRTCNCSRSH